MGEMLKKILFVGVATACLSAPAIAESYVSGDGCGGTYLDRKSEMMAGNITGGTRYKCTPFPKKAKPATKTSTRSSTQKHSYSRPTTSSHTYSTGRVTYSTPRHSTHHSGHRYHSGHSYVTTHPTTTYLHGSGHSSGSYVTTTPKRHYKSHSSHGHVTTHPSTSYHHGTSHYSTGTTYRPSSQTYSSGHRHRSGATSTYTSGNVMYETVAPIVTYTDAVIETVAPIKTKSSGGGTHAPVPKHANPYGTPRVDGNLANSFTTETDMPDDSKSFSFSKPETFIRTNPK